MCHAETPIRNRDAALCRRTPYWDWLPLITLPVAASLARNAVPAWIFMWLLALTIFLGCKWLTWRRACRRIAHPGLARFLAYSFAWPGMDAAAFAGYPEFGMSLGFRALGFGFHSDWLLPTAKTCAGAMLIWFAARRALELGPLAAGWLGMVGLALMLHFGVFELLALAWQKAGVRVQPLMRTPLRAASLAEFWGERWNTAFNVLVHDLAFRPLARRWGVAGATLAVFLISGLVHEAVISVPARGGFGLPTSYFALQGLGVLTERSVWGRRAGLGRGWRGKLFAAGCAAGPASWLFHPTFVRNVILPMLNAIGAT